MVDDTIDFSVKMLAVVPESPNSECTNRVDWNDVCCTLRRNPIAVNHSDTMVGNGIDSEVQCEALPLSAHDSIHVEMDIQWTVGFELDAVCIEWNEPVE